MAYPDLDADLLPYRESATALTTGGLAGVNKLWLPRWAGEVILAYDEYNAFEKLVEHRTDVAPVIEFPVTGTVTGNVAWGAGVELSGNPSEYSSTTFAVRIDKRPIVAYCELDNIDLALTQWDYQAQLARQAAQWLAKIRDKQLGVYIMKAGYAPALDNDPRGVTPMAPYASDNLFYLGGANSGTADQRTTAALTLLNAIETFHVNLQNSDIPADGPTFCAVNPATFQDIRSLGVARDATGLAGGAGRPFFGGVAEAGGLGTALGVGMWKMTDMLEYQGCYIVKTNHLPTANYSSSNIGESKYNLDCTTISIKALIWKPEAVISMRFQAVQPYSEYDGRRNTTFTRVSMFNGTGIKKPELAMLVVSGLTSNTASNQDTRAKIKTLIGDATEYISTSGSNYPYA